MIVNDVKFDLFDFKLIDPHICLIDLIKSLISADEVHKEFLLFAPNYEDGFDGFKKNVSEVS